MRLKEWREVLSTDFPAVRPVTKETVDLVKKEGRRFRGSMRVSTGRLWTSSVYERHRKKVLSTPLP